MLKPIPLALSGEDETRLKSLAKGVILVRQKVCFKGSPLASPFALMSTGTQPQALEEPQCKKATAKLQRGNVSAPGAHRARAGHLFGPVPL